jgi:DNA relaxase NicK
MTTGVHWYRGTTVLLDLVDVLGTLTDAWGTEVVPLGHGRYGYQDGYQVGEVFVWHHPERSDMGVCVEVEGKGCEILGGTELAWIHRTLGLKSSRIDVAMDGVPFTPAQLRDAWQAGDVRSRAKVTPRAREDRRWRKCEWHSNNEGDTFEMGSRSSTQYARCYDRLGPVRFEMEWKHETAARVADEILGAIWDETHDIAARVLGWVRRFVDFVDASSSAHASRRALLGWWAAFVADAQVASFRLAAQAARTVEAVRDWFEVQMSATLAVIREAFGDSEVRRLTHQGKKRWRSKHRAALVAGGFL